MHSVCKTQHFVVCNSSAEFFNSVLMGLLLSLGDTRHPLIMMKAIMMTMRIMEIMNMRKMMMKMGTGAFCAKLEATRH